MQKQHKKPPELEQPELPNMPPKPLKPERIYKVTLIEAKKRIYCKIDYEKTEEIENQSELAEIIYTVRRLENILNQLKKKNILLIHQSYEQHYNTNDNTNA